MEKYYTNQKQDATDTVSRVQILANPVFVERERDLSVLTF